MHFCSELCLFGCALVSNCTNGFPRQEISRVQGLLCSLRWAIWVLERGFRRESWVCCGQVMRKGCPGLLPYSLSAQFLFICMACCLRRESVRR